MNDMHRLKSYYKQRLTAVNYWQDFNCYPFYLSQSGYKILIDILKANNIKSNNDMADKQLLDIGAGEGNFLLNLIKLGASPSNITAVELVEERFNKLKDKIPRAKLFNDDYLSLSVRGKYHLITIMAVLTSILDDNIRAGIVAKAYEELGSDGFMIIYDYNKQKEVFMGANYRAVSFEKIIRLIGANKKDYKIYSKMYINVKIGKALCMMRMGWLIPAIQFLKVFNDDYSFLVVTK